MAKNTKQRSALFLGLLTAAVLAQAKIIYVTHDGTDPSGAEWATSTSLTNALAIAGEADEIWLAQGTYANTATFIVRTNCAVYGGFTIGMTARDDRDWEAHPVILNGMGQNRRVVTVTGTNVVLDGLVITNSSGSAAGGISKAVAGSLTLANCRIMNHSAAQNGIGASFTAGSVVMTNCLVANNAETTWYLHGWGIYSYGANLDLVDCVISNNSLNSFRASAGLGLYFGNGRLLARHTRFVDNVGPANSGTGGAGAYLGGSSGGTSATFSNCIFRGNVAKYCGSGGAGYGAALFVNLPAAATAQVVNCTFTANTNLIGYGGAIGLNSGTLVLRNSILWNNGVGTGLTGGEIYRTGGTLDINYCNLTALEYPHVVGAILPQNCRAHDPLFASATDLHLKSPAGRWDPASQAFVTDDTSYSPCIDGGDPADSIGDEPTDNGNSRVNLGAYGGTAQASKSPPPASPLLENLGHSVFYHRVVLSGRLTNEPYASAHVYLCYGTSAIASDTTNGWDVVTYMGERQTGAQYSTRTPILLPETAYFYRWYAVNDYGENWTATASFTTGVTPAGGGADVIHVDRQAVGYGDGIDWANACTNLADAIRSVGGSRTNVWLTGDRYTHTLAQLPLSGDAVIIGGFTGAETAVSQRTLTNSLGIVTNYTLIDGENTRQCLQITAGNVAMECLVFTNARSGYVGGGLAKTGSGRLTMENCRLVNNRGSKHGIGAYFNGGSVLMTNCIVANNSSVDWYAYGYGVYSENTTLDMVDCLFSNNSVNSWRGSAGLGLYVTGGKVDARRTDFVDNSGPANNGTLGGAGVSVRGNATASFSNCVFRGNVAKYCGSGSPGVGGAMWVDQTAAGTTRVINCTFTANSNLYGNGGAIALTGAGTLIVKNSILWNNGVDTAYTGHEIYRVSGTLDMTFCCLTAVSTPHVVGATLPDNCITQDPLFASKTDLHLQSPAGRWDPALGEFVTTDPEFSFSIDAGDPDDPIGDEPTDNGNVRVNLGRYGGTKEASKSPPPSPPMVADRGYTVSNTHALIRGEIANEEFVSADVFLCFGMSKIETDTTNGWDMVTSLGSKANGIEFSIWTPPLLEETPYWYRWYVVNNDGSSWSAATSFDSGTAAPGGGPNVIHVDNRATGAGDGTDWNHAFASIAKGFTALDATHTQVWITGGTYLEGAPLTLPQGATLIGGFEGTEASPAERALTDARGTVTNWTVFDANNASAGLTLNTGTNAVLLESLVFANGVKTGNGCGIEKNNTGNLTLINCKLINNRSSGNGSGAYFGGGTILMTNCVVAQNKQSDYYTHGWGIHSSGANLDLVDCVFSNNSVIGYRQSKGLGLYFNNGRLSAVRTEFLDHIGPANSGMGGAGVCVDNGANTSATFSNCIFRGNVALQCDGMGSSGYGAGMWINLAAAGTARVVNCTFTANTNLFGHGGAIALSSGTLILKNSILWSNNVAAAYTGKELYRNGGTLRVDYCALTGTNDPTVTGEAALSNVITNDPLFASEKDLHLRSRQGRWNPETATWIKDFQASPCIDAGDPADPVGMELKPNRRVINLGAYGGTVEASLSLLRHGSVIMVW